MITDRMRERELRRSWPHALALAAAVAVGTGLLVGLVMWLLGRSWENGAFIGFFFSLVYGIMPRVVVRYEAWQERRRAVPRPPP